MSHIDVINLYQDYRKLGKSEEESTLLIKSLDINTADFVTKSEFSYEMEKFRHEIKQDFTELKSELRLDIRELKIEFKWMWRALAGITIVLVIPLLKNLIEWIVHFFQ